MRNIQKDFEKNGYVIVPADKPLISKIQKKILSIIQKNIKKKLK